MVRWSVASSGCSGEPAGTGRLIGVGVGETGVAVGAGVGVKATVGAGMIVGAGVGVRASAGVCASAGAKLQAAARRAPRTEKRRRGGTGPKSIPSPRSRVQGPRSGGGRRRTLGRGGGPRTLDRWGGGAGRC